MKRSRQFALWAAAILAGSILGVFTRPEAASPLAAPAAGSEQAIVAPSESEAMRAVLTALAQRGDFRQLAQLGSLLAELNAQEMREVIAKVDGWPSKERDTWLPRLVGYWTRIDPAAATEWMASRLATFAADPGFGAMADANSNLTNAWVENAPERALEAARQYFGTHMGRILLQNAIFALRGNEDPERLEVLRSFPAGKERTRVMNALFRSWAQSPRDQAAALAAAESLEAGAERDGAIREVLGRWATREPQVAIDKAKALGVQNPATWMVLIKEMTKADPAGAARALEGMDPALLPHAGSVLIQYWSATDPAAAFEWAMAHGVSLTGGPPKRSDEDVQFIWGHDFTLSANLLRDAMAVKADAVLAWGRSLPPGPDRERYLELILRASANPATVAPYLSELSPEGAARAAEAIARNTASRDLQSAREWAESLPVGAVRESAWAGVGATQREPLPLPPGPDRDAMLMGMALTQRIQQPLKALERAVEIGDPALRRRTFDDVMWELYRDDDFAVQRLRWGAVDVNRKAVAEWLKTAPIPDDWKRR